jgi:hypothetical protein
VTEGVRRRKEGRKKKKKKKKKKREGEVREKLGEKPNSRGRYRHIRDAEYNNRIYLYLWRSSLQVGLVGVHC